RSVDPIGFHLLDSAAPLPPPPTTFEETTLAPEKLDEYVGTYAASPQLELTVTRDGSTIDVQLTGQPAFPIYAEKADKFFYRVVDARIDFVRDASGNVVSLTLHQNGRDLEFVREPPTTPTPTPTPPRE
ncbi:MAG TPA: DUF3471 domain-containing protein, partial [Gammaproteobacteria bacterium]|nr:DUF3471 domain-containing protein [Gammaproteobacteria bacterium]